MILNSRLLSAQNSENNLPVLLIHGLFGSLDNLGILARDLQATHPILQIDVRNHGLSPHSEQMDYPSLAMDVLDTLNHHHLQQVIVIGHSMGGKIAMKLCALAPQRVKQLIVIDIAPVNYPTRRHDEIFSALFAVQRAAVHERHAAATIMRATLSEPMVIQFLLKSFHQGTWRFNLDALWHNYSLISGWETLPSWSGPCLFIRGKDSAYLDDQYRDALLAQFPNARAHIVSGAGHWVHAEKPVAVLQAVQRFLANQP